MPDTPRTESNDGGGPRVLVVEDDPGMGRYLLGCLGPLGARVAVVKDGDEALARLRGAEERFDLVITDMVMSGLGGRDLIREIDRDPGLRSVPVLVVTGMTGEIEAGGRPVLHKPFGASLLRTYVNEILGRQREREGGIQP